MFITNVVKARPPTNRDPRPDVVEHHLPWLLAQLDVIEPKVIVPHGRPVEQTERGRTIVPWYHPAAAIYNRSLRESLHEDARRLGEMLRDA